MLLPIYVIHLPKDTKRAESINQQFSEYGLSYEFIEGVNGKNPSDEEKQLIVRRYSREHAQRVNANPFTSGEIGCALGHIRIYEKMVQESIPEALIFEDDAIIDDRLIQFLEQRERIMRGKKWEYLSLNYEILHPGIFLRDEIASIKINKKRLFLAIPRIMAAIFFGAYERVQQCIPRIRPVRFFRPLYLAGGYVVTLEGAKKLLELSSPYLQYPADRLPNQARIQKNLQFFAIAPLLVRQNKGFVSNIEEQK